MDTHNKQNEDKGGVNPIVAAVTGAIVGAGVVVAGAVALSDKKNSDKVKEVLTGAKDKAINYMNDVQKTVETKKDKIEEKLAEGKREIKKVANSAEDNRKATDIK